MIGSSILWAKDETTTEALVVFSEMFGDGIFFFFLDAVAHSSLMDVLRRLGRLEKLAVSVTQYAPFSSVISYSISLHDHL